MKIEALGIDLMSSESLTVAIAVVSLISLLFAMVVAWAALREARSRREDQRIVLSEAREYYEARLKEMNQRLLATKERWEEVNHLVISGQQRQSDTLQFFDPKEIPIFADHGLSDQDLSIIPDLAFVLTPVLRSEEKVYQAVADACNGVGLRAHRADMDVIPGDILKQVVEYIARCRVVVANVSIRNPNVYYELGIAHTLGKPTILISRTVSQVSFDIAANRVITFSHPDELAVKLQEALRSVLRPNG